MIFGTYSKPSVDGTVKPILNTYVYMSESEYRNVRLTEEAYQRLKSCKQPGESFSDTVERSLLDLAGIRSEEEAEEMSGVITESRDHSRERLDRLTDRLDP